MVPSVFFVIMKISRISRLSDALRSLSRQLLFVQEEERREISRELHDVIAQTLTGINVRLAGLKATSNTTSTELHNQITSTQQARPAGHAGTGRDARRHLWRGVNPWPNHHRSRRSSAADGCPQNQSLDISATPNLQSS